ncbi:DinB family protein [Pseudomonas viridiflava]|uniref:DinB family protein n=1 Tax=Pseudomonas viridiflava TaxID=33069 RepID=UPI000F061254|nr:DinB family protein [Pseudomonas viridiflava]
MNRLDHIQLMAAYNQWMNDKLYVAAARLPEEALSADRAAFFGSIMGTLNHLLVGDTLWLKRFARHPAGFPALDVVRDLPDPKALSEQVFNSLSELSAQRRRVDQAIIEWTVELQEVDLDVVLRYANTAGIPAARDFYGLLIHFFNHQTHHRGQATTLLTQAGVDVGSTDLLGLIPDID